MGGRESAMPAKGLQVRLMPSLSLWARLKIRGVYFRCQGSASKDDGISGDRRCRRDLPAFAGCAEPDWASYTYVVGRCSGAGAEIETCKDPAKRETGGPFQNTHHQKRQTHIFFTSDACFLNSAVHETPPLILYTCCQLIHSVIMCPQLYFHWSLSTWPFAFWLNMRRAAWYVRPRTSPSLARTLLIGMDSCAVGDHEEATACFELSPGFQPLLHTDPCK